MCTCLIVFYIETSTVRGLKPEQDCCATGREHVEDGGVNRIIIQRALGGMAECCVD